jgi:hypothetical protein
MDDDDNEGLIHYLQFMRGRGSRFALVKSVLTNAADSLHGPRKAARLYSDHEKIWGPPGVKIAVKKCGKICDTMGKSDGHTPLLTSITTTVRKYMRDSIRNPVGPESTTKQHLPVA